MPGSFSKSFAANNYNHSQSYACKIFNKCWNWRDFSDRHESSCSFNSRFRIRRVTKFSKFFTQKSKIPDQYRFLVTKRIISVPMDNIHISESTNWQHTIIQIHFLRWVVSRHKRGGGSERGQKKNHAQLDLLTFFSKIRAIYRASPKYVKCPKKDSVIKVSLESDILFSVEIWLKVIF